MFGRPLYTESWLQGGRWGSRARSGQALQELGDETKPQGTGHSQCRRAALGLKNDSDKFFPCCRDPQPPPEMQGPQMAQHATLCGRPGRGQMLQENTGRWGQEAQMPSWGHKEPQSMVTRCVDTGSPQPLPGLALSPSDPGPQVGGPCEGPWVGPRATASSSLEVK